MYSSKEYAMLMLLIYQLFNFNLAPALILMTFKLIANCYILLYHSKLSWSYLNPGDTLMALSTDNLIAACPNTV